MLLSQALKITAQRTGEAGNLDVSAVNHAHSALDLIQVRNVRERIVGVNLCDAHRRETANNNRVVWVNDVVDAGLLNGVHAVGEGGGDNGGGCVRGADDAAHL